MQCLEARLASFAAVTKPKRLAKVAFPLDAKTHPNLTPEALANAGFYHTPGKASDEDTHDTCRCFLCGLVLGGWDEDDDPYAEHVKRDGECAWKEVVCRVQADRATGGPGRLRTVYPDADALPNSERSTGFRERTFGDWWPHETPSAHELAQAGFVSVPSKAAPDGTMCPLCRYEVEAWEENDDPWLIHNKKEPECPFFTATVEASKKAAKPRAKAAAKPKRATRANTATIETEAEQEAEPQVQAEAAEVEKEEPPAPAPKRRGRPPKASTAKASASTSTRGRKKADTKEAGDGQEPDAEVVSKPARATRSRSGSKAPAVPPAQVPSVEPVVEEADEPQRKTKPLPRKGKGRATTTNAAAEEEEPEPSRATRSAPARKMDSHAPTPPPKPQSQPLSDLDRFMNVPPPPSPSVKHAVDAMIRAASPAPASPARPSALSEEQKKMTLEEYVRQQYRIRHDEMRADGEAMIRAWETRSAEARTRLERV